MRWTYAMGLSVGLLTACSAVVDPDTDLLGDQMATDLGMQNVDGGGVDAGPGECAGGCDDGVACTADRCIDGRCLQAADNSLCGAGERCDVLSGCVPDTCETDADCGNDGIDCNGIETCSGGSCITMAGTTCDDGDPCTADLCDPGAGGCVTTIVDGDGDGAPAMSVGGVSCGGTDCADDDPSRYPGATEVCDGADQDCDGSIDEDAMCGGSDGDRCDDVVMLTLDGSGRATYRATLSAGYADDYDTPCGSGDGRDLVLGVPFNGIRDFRIDTTGSSFDTVLAASPRCGEFDIGGRGCNDDIDYNASNTQSRLWVHRIGQFGVANTLYIMVEGYNASDVGDVVVEVQMRDAVTDACSGSLNITGGGSVLGFAGSVGAERGSCQGFEFAPEGSFIIEPARRQLALTAYSTEFAPDLHVRLTCAARDELMCVTGTSSGGVMETDIARDIPLDGLPRDINVFVDGATAGAPYTLDYRP